MSDYSFPQINCDKYNVIINAESEQKAKEIYDILYGIVPDS